MGWIKELTGAGKENKTAPGGDRTGLRRRKAARNAFPKARAASSGDGALLPTHGREILPRSSPPPPGFQKGENPEPPGAFAAKPNAGQGSGRRMSTAHLKSVSPRRAKLAQKGRTIQPLSHRHKTTGLKVRPSRSTELFRPSPPSTRLPAPTRATRGKFGPPGK